MKKMVKYNGGKQSVYGCSDPEKLIIGNTYEVISEDDEGWQTNYHLKGVVGRFNSVWFDDIPTYLASASRVPIKGTRYRCYRMKPALGGIPSMVCTLTNLIQKVERLENNIYWVLTKDTAYIVQVGQ